jgi:hypothetical protein
LLTIVFDNGRNTFFIYGRLPRRKQRGMRSLKRFKSRGRRADITETISNHMEIAIPPDMTGA